jgi:hypothetical protein
MGSNSSNLHAEQIGQVVRVTRVGRDAVFVDEAGVERADERAAVLDVQFEAVGLAGGQQMQRRRENNFVLDKVLGGAREIHGDVAVVQRVVNELDVLAQVENLLGCIGCCSVQSLSWV